jgi:5-bromo-4-chloroindolyl phosphate hydrolysis protein
MKVIIINRKRLGVTTIIIGLMLTLLGFEKYFDARLKFASLMQNNINSLIQYKALDNKLSYKLPSEWITKEQNFSGQEIIYHNDFQSRDAKIHGFVEVWNINQDLKAFLEDSKKISSKQNIYKQYKMNPIRINNRDGYLIDYIIITPSDEMYRGYEYFIKNGNKFFRLSFFAKENDFKENMPVIFSAIAQTLNYKE